MLRLGRRGEALVSPQAAWAAVSGAKGSDGEEQSRRAAEAGEARCTRVKLVSSHESLEASLCRDTRHVATERQDVAKCGAVRRANSMCLRPPHHANGVPVGFSALYKTNMRSALPRNGENWVGTGKWHPCRKMQENCTRQVRQVRQAQKSGEGCGISNATRNRSLPFSHPDFGFTPKLR